MNNAAVLIERIGYVTLGRTNEGWYASGFASNSTRDYRGYGPSVLLALTSLASQIDVAEAPRRARTVPLTTGFYCTGCERWFPAPRHQCLVGLR